MNQAPALSSRFERWQQMALGVGVIGLLVGGAGAFLGLEQFLRSYLFGYLFWVGITLGCLALMLLQYLVRGSWGIPIQRLLEAGARTLPLMALLFIPILLSLPVLYEWARPQAVAADAVLQAKQPYLNVPFFIARAVVYFVLWGGIVYLLTRRAWAVEQSADPEAVSGLRTASALSLLLFSLTATFAFVDWAMSLEPRWYSTIYSALVVVGGVVGAFALVILVALRLARREPLASAITPRTLNDLGALLLALVVLWAYLAFSQFFLIWAGNLSEEVPWYLRRLQGGWEWVALLVAIIHFALPFFLLLARDMKRDARVLSGVAALLVVAELIDVFWLITPAFHETQFALHWLDLVAPVAIGGLWAAMFLWQARQRPLLPEGMRRGHSG